MFRYSNVNNEKQLKLFETKAKLEDENNRLGKWSELERAQLRFCAL